MKRQYMYWKVCQIKEHTIDVNVHCWVVTIAATHPLLRHGFGVYTIVSVGVYVI